MKRVFSKGRQKYERLKGRGRIRFQFFAVRLQDGELIVKGDLKSMFIRDDEQVGLSIQPVDKAGNPAEVSGSPSWSSSDPTILTVVPSADGLSAVAAAVGKLGKATVSVTLGSISGTLDVEVHSDAAVSVTITAGTPAARA
jgi:hypothetical protein